MQVKDSENGIYQWIYLAAESVTDVTASHTADLEKYAVTLPEGVAAADVKEGYVYEIKLNKEKQQLKMPKLKLVNQLENLIKVITIRHLSNFRNSTDSKNQQEEGLVLLILMSFFISLEYQFPNLLY